MRKFFALLVLVLFVVLAPAAIYAVNLQSTLLVADFYKDTLQRSNAYERLGPVLAEIVVSDLEERLAEEFGEDAPPLPKEELEGIVAELIEPRWLKGQVEGAVDDFFAWLENNEALPNVSLNLRPIKEQLPGVMPQIITAFFAKQWEELPLCAAGEIPTFTDFGPSCRPPRGYSGRVPGPALGENSRLHRGRAALYPRPASSLFATGCGRANYYFHLAFYPRLPRRGGHPSWPDTPVPASRHYRRRGHCFFEGPALG